MFYNLRQDTAIQALNGSAFFKEKGANFFLSLFYQLTVQTVGYIASFLCMSTYFW